MGQKVHPIGMRLGIASDWRSKWYAEGKDYASFLHKDLEVRAYLKKRLKEEQKRTQDPWILKWSYE